MNHLTRLAAAVAILTALSTSVLAEQSSNDEMDNVARNWVAEMAYRTGDWANDVNPTVRAGQDIRQNGEVLARCFNVSPRGFVVVPILRELPPVMFYSEENSIDVSLEVGLAQLIKDVIASRLQLYHRVYGDLAAVQPAEGDVLFDRSQKAEWSRLAVTPKEFRPVLSLTVLEQGGPLLTSSWHQLAPYSDSCPVGDYGQRCPVGCAGTALATVINYWKWPLSGIGSRSYWWDGDGCLGDVPVGRLLTADFSDSYDWSNMPDSCDGADGCTAEQRAAVAELCFEAGMALHMTYKTCYGAALMDMAGLVSCFNYENSVSREHRTDHTRQSWYDVIKSEIDGGRVTWYGILAHSIVCDGYRDNAGQLEFHMNYGWGGEDGPGGSSNAWYVTDNLYCYWSADSLCPYEEEQVTINIRPQYDPVVWLDRTTIGDDAGDGDGLAEPGETALITPVVINSGNHASVTTGLLTTSDPFLTVNDGGTTFDPVITPGDTSVALSAFALAVSPECPNPYVATCLLKVNCDGGYQSSSPLFLFLGDVPGFSDDMESGPGFWRSRFVTVQGSDEWHLETHRSHSGATGWKFGGPGPEPYSATTDGELISPPFLLPANSRLTFWHWIGADLKNSYEAWEGGIVLIRENGGEWTQISPIDEYPYLISRDARCALESSTPCFSGEHDWSEEIFDLSTYTDVVQLKFRFATGWIDQMEGWYIDDIWVGNTVTGANVSLSPYPGVTVTYPNVLTRGSTGASVSFIGPEPPSSFTPVPASPREYFSLTTDAVYSGDAEVCLTYSDQDGFGIESNLKILAWDGGVWTDLTTSVDAGSNKVCCLVHLPTTLLLAEKIGCCVGRVGDANGSGGDEPTIGDVSAMIDGKLISGTCDGIIACIAEADVNHSGGTDPDCDDITIGDISTLIDYLFITGSTLGLPACL